MAGLSSAEGVVCLYSFVLGILRFSVISFSFFFYSSILRMTPTCAIIFCHANMASMYLAEALTGTVSKTKLGIPRTAVVLSCQLVVVFVIPLVWGNSLWKVNYIGTSLLILVSGILGGLIHCLKHIFINEYNLPEDQQRYLNMKFWVVELEYVGKTIGGFLAMGTVLEEPSIIFTGSCWMLLAVFQLFIAMVGLMCFQKQKDNRNIIKEFIKHSLFAMKAQLSNRRNGSEKFTDDDMERIKIVHSVLPLYLPVVILIGIKDLKYSRYTWQSTNLSLDVFDGSYNPQKILMMYPLTVAIFLPLYHYCGQPLFKKFMPVKLRTTTRAIVSFYFMALSLAFATVLECRIELDHKRVHVNETMRAVDVFNFLPCVALLKSNCEGITGNKVLPFDMNTLQCPLYTDYSAVLVQGVCYTGNIRRYFSMTVVLNRQQDIRVAIGYDLRHAKKHPNGSKALPVFFQHLHEENLDDSQSLTIVYNIVQNHSLRIVTAVKRRRKWIPSGATVFEKKLIASDKSHLAYTKVLEDGRYAILIDDEMVERLHYKSLRSFALMVCQDNPDVKTVAKIILVHQKPSRHVLYQLPQIVSSALAEMFIEAPGFVYGRKKVPIQWNDFVSVVWTFCSFLGNLIIVVGGYVSYIDRNLTALLIGSAGSIVAIALISVFLLDYYKADYIEE